MIDLGERRAGVTLRFPFNSNAIAGESITLATNGAVRVYKDGDLGQTTTGATLSEDYDGVTGTHVGVIDTSADGTFYSEGSDFMVMLQGATIDGQAVNAWLGTFSLANRAGLRPATAGRTLNVNSSGEADVDVKKWTGTIVAAPDTAGYPKVTHKVGTGTGELSLSSGAVLLQPTQSGVTIPTVTNLTNAPTNGDLTAAMKASVNAEADTALADYAALKPTTPGRTLDVSADGEAGIDLANVGSPTTTLTLSGTTIKTATDVEADTQDIQSRIPAALTGAGNIKADAQVVSDKTGYALATAPPTAAQIRTEMETAGGMLVTIRDRIGAFTGTGVNTILGFLKALGSKAASTPSDMGGSFDAANDSTEAIRDRGDDAWAGGGGGFDPATDPVIVGDVQAAALAKFFTQNSGADFGDAVAGSVVREIAENVTANVELSQEDIDQITDAILEAADPLASAVPGSYPVGSAGHKIGLIGTGGALVQVPVAEDGTLTLTVGKRQMGALALVWTSDSARDYEASGTTIRLEFGGLGFEAAVAGAPGGWTFTVELDADDAATLSVLEGRGELAVYVSGAEDPAALAFAVVVLPNV